MFWMAIRRDMFREMCTCCSIFMLLCWVSMGFRRILKASRFQNPKNSGILGILTILSLQDSGYFLAVDCGDSEDSQLSRFWNFDDSEESETPLASKLDSGILKNQDSEDSDDSGTLKFLNSRAPDQKSCNSTIRIIELALERTSSSPFPLYFLFR